MILLKKCLILLLCFGIAKQTSLVLWNIGETSLPGWYLERPSFTMARMSEARSAAVR
jgi:hypothetical protein